MSLGRESGDPKPETARGVIAEAYKGFVELGRGMVWATGPFGAYGSYGLGIGAIYEGGRADVLSAGNMESFWRVGVGVGFLALGQYLENNWQRIRTDFEAERQAELRANQEN